MNEKDIEKMFLDYLNTSGKGYFFKIENQGTFDSIRKTYRLNPRKTKGISDIIGITYSGRLVAIEVKTPKTKNRVSQDQKNFLARIKEMGGLCGVAWDIDSLNRIFV